MTEPHAGITYVSVVSYGTIHIIILITTLNDFNINTVDIFNNYVMMPVKEKLLFMLLVGLGEDVGKTQ